MNIRQAKKIHNKAIDMASKVAKEWKSTSWKIPGAPEWTDEEVDIVSNSVSEAIAEEISSLKK